MLPESIETSICKTILLVELEITEAGMTVNYYEWCSHSSCENRVLLFQSFRESTHVTASGKLICIAGDAATSLPYFRSLNNFLVVGAELGRKLGSVTKTELSKAGKDYESYAGRRALLEGFKARAKNLFVNLLKLFLWTSNYAPCEVVQT